MAWAFLNTAVLAALLIALFALGAFLLSRLRPPSLSSSGFHSFPVVERFVANAGERPVIFLTLGVSTASLPTGAHVKIRALINGEMVTRSYTPTRFNRGRCELMFRVYPGGPMTTFLAGLRVGDAVEMKGPTGLERYGVQGPGTFSRGDATWAGVTHVGLISGGTGITPMLQIANHVLQDASDATRLSLACFHNSYPDILLSDTLRKLAAGSRGALELKFVCTHVGDNELRGHSDVRRGSMRALSGAQLVALLGVPVGKGTVICICGTDGFAERARELLEPHFPGNVLVW